MVAIITATNMTMAPLECAQPCSVSATITWTNIGDETTTINPVMRITKDGVNYLTVIWVNVTFAPGQSVTKSYNRTGLDTGNYIFCPDPN